jgi:hypothetical protein
MTDFIKYSINSKWRVNITAKRCKSSVLGRPAFSEGEEENAGELGRPFRDAPFASVRGQGGKVFGFLPPPMVEGHGGRMMVADTWHLAGSDTHIIRLLGLPSPKCLEKMNFRKST